MKIEHNDCYVSLNDMIIEDPQGTLTTEAEKIVTKLFLEIDIDDKRFYNSCVQCTRWDNCMGLKRLSSKEKEKWN